MRYSLRCRVCESVTAATPNDACLRCDGPTDITYEWPLIAATVDRAALAGRPQTLWRYEALLPAGARVDYGAGWTPLGRSARLSELLGVDVRVKLESANPTGSYKDRMATLAAAAALDHGVTTLCCSSTGHLGDAVAAAAAASGLEAIVLVPAGPEANALAARNPRAKVLAVDGTYDDCRRLELELGGLFPWGYVSGNLHPYAAEGARTVSFEIAEQLDWRLPDAVFCPAASGVLFSKLTQAFGELTLAGLAGEPVPAMFAAQARGSSPIAAAYADDRGVSSVRASTRHASLAVGDPSHGDLAIGAARATGGAIFAVDDGEIETHTELFAAATGLEPDCATGAALAALVRAIKQGDVMPGATVVLVVTGAPARVARASTGPVTVAADAPDVLTALGLDS